MNSASSGSTTSPSRASSSEWRMSSSNSTSDSGSCQLASRTATKASAPAIAAMTIAPSAISSTALTRPIVLRPWPRTTTTRPTDSAPRAASATRRAWPEARGNLDTRIPCLLERAGDHEPLNLVRALVDLGDLGVSHHALDRILLDITVATQHLHRLHGHGHGCVRAEDLGHRGVLRALGMTLVGDRTRLVEQLRGGRTH